MDTKLIIIIVILIMALLGVFGIFIGEYIFFVKSKKDVLKQLEKYGKIKKENNLIHLETKNKTYQIIFFRTKKLDFITINSSKIIEIKNRSKFRYIKYDYSKGNHKILIPLPYSNITKKVINENEVEFVDYKTSFNNFNIVLPEEINDFIKYIGD